MSKALIITEKPSVARDIAAALGGFTEKEKGAYFESDQYVVTYAVGHLFSLLNPEDIDSSLKRWTLKTLPIIPEQFEIKPRDDQKSRIGVINRLINRKDVASLINACDAAREGELIFREIVDHAKTDLPIKRLWLQSMVPDSIRKGFGELKDEKEVRGLAEAAKCRAYSDWLIGMNATRALSVRLRTRSERTPWSAGRVQTPTLALLVERELEILGHTPESYWKVTAKFKPDSSDEYEGTWIDPTFKRNDENPEQRADRIFDEKIVKQILEDIKGQSGLASETRKPREQKAPVLFNLTALQKTMSSRFGWTAKRTLQAAQRCYEAHKVLTYPRTNSSCLPNDYVQEVDRIIDIYAGVSKYSESAKYLQKNGRLNEKRVFDDKGVSDHFAIIPTGEVKNLDGDDFKLYDTVVRRFLSTFFPPAVYEKVERMTIVKGHHFKTGPLETLVVPGWLSVYDREKDDEKNPTLKPLLPNAKDATDVPVVEKTAESHPDQTKPPARIGEARLLSLMEHAGRAVEDEELASALVSAEGLGTAATRADIIENLKQKEYVDRSLRPTPKGIRLIDILHRIDASRLTSAELTGKVEVHLAEVEEGKRKMQEFINEISEYTREVVECARNFDFDAIYPNENPLGKCPKCQSGDVFEKAWHYVCEKNDRDHEASCDFVIWKNSWGRYIDRKTVAKLLDQGKTDVLDGFRNMQGISYKAALAIEDGKLELLSSGGSNAELGSEQIGDPLGKCPIHDDCDVIETDGAFICQSRLKAMSAGEKRPNGFLLPKVVCQREMELEEAKTLLEKKETDFIGGFVSKRGRKFLAKLVLKEDGRHAYEFPPRAPKKTKEEKEEEKQEKAEGQAKNSSGKKKSSEAPAAT